MATQSFRYSPLSQDLRQIRLIYLQKAHRHTDPIRCEIKTVSLKEAPDFEALSYVWGTSENWEHIYLNDTKIRATKNLHAALYHIRNVFGSVILWIDALCINQSDILERNHQVQLMRDIFSTASRVIAWLGSAKETGKESTTLAVTVLRRIAHAAKEYELGDFQLVNRLPELYRPIDPKPQVRHGKVARAMAYRHWSWKCVLSLFIEPSNWKYRAGTSIANMFKREYWQRVWILQEFALASDLLVMCGTECINIENLIPFFTMIEREYPKLTHNSPLTRGEWWKNASTLISLRRSAEPGKEEIFGLVERTTKFYASDPRDKIIGLLGLSNSDILPDYAQSVGLIYWNFALTWLEERRDLSILIPAELTEYGRRSASVFRGGLPSWAPDWQHLNIDVVGSGKHLCHYRAAGTTRTQLEVVADGKVLRVVGVPCGKVTCLGPGMTRYKVEGLQNCRRFCDEHIFGPGSDNGRNGINKMDAFVRLILNDIDPISGRKLDTKSTTYPHMAASIYSRIFEEEFEQLKLVRDYFKQTISNSNHTSSLLRGDPHSLQSLNALSEKLISHEKMYDHIDDWNRDRRLFVMDHGYMGVAPEGTMVGDDICVFYGFNLPVVLRQVDGHTIFIGICFVVGLVDGEALDIFGLLEQVFDIY